MLRDLKLALQMFLMFKKLPLKQGRVGIDGLTGVSKAWSEGPLSLLFGRMGLVPGVYGGQVSLLVTSLQSLLRPAVASTHQEGAAVGQVGSGGAVTQAAVSKSEI